MIIHQPEVLIEGDQVILQADVETSLQDDSTPSKLWFKYPKEYAPWISLRLDGFVWSLLQRSMFLGEDLVCNGEVSPRILYSSEEFQDLYIYWFPNLFKRKIRIQAGQITLPEVNNTREFAFSFSGGVDSLFNVFGAANHLSALARLNLRYGIFIQGAADIPLTYEDKFRQLENEYRNLLDNLGYKLLPVSTNIMQYFANNLPFKATINAPLVGSAMGLGGLLSGLVIGTDTTFDQYKIKGAGLLVAHLQSSESVDILQGGSAYRRIQRIELLADWPAFSDHVRVCNGFNSASNVHNCSNCGKCIRTRMILHILGKLTKARTFRTTFGLRDYLYWARWMDIGWDYEWDTLELARQRKKSIVPILILMILIGYFRHFLRIILPRKIQKFVFKFISPPNPHLEFAKPEAT